MKILKNFIKKLKEIYPEKLVYLMGIEYQNSELALYIKDKKLTTHTFKPDVFKKFLDERNNIFSSKNNNANLRILPASLPRIGTIGDIMLDTETNIIKMFDGTDWVTLVDYNQSGVS